MLAAPRGEELFVFASADEEVFEVGEAVSVLTGSGNSVFGREGLETDGAVCAGLVGIGARVGGSGMGNLKVGGSGARFIGASTRGGGACGRQLLFSLSVCGLKGFSNICGANCSYSTLDYMDLEL